MYTKYQYHFAYSVAKTNDINVVKVYVVRHRGK